ncbi:MAG: BON domain-containing protein [Bryobacteraceae bacterium]
MKRIYTRTLILMGALLIGSTLAQATISTKAQSKDRLAEQVRRELAMLPWYNVFDYLTFSLHGDTVVLAGYATRPVLKADAERAVRRIEGVARVKNEIEVLPLSPYDNRIRMAVYRTLYSQPALQRYAMGVRPNIHILVNNGRVTLIGVVANQGDRTIANIAANSVPGVFSVSNNITVRRGKV